MRSHEPGSRLGAAIKQTRPFASVEAAVAIALQRLAGRQQDQVVELLRTHGLSLPQFNVLRILRGAGADGLPSGEIGSRMVTRDPDMTRLLDRLEREGMVHRCRAEHDRRVITCRLTMLGRKRVDALDAPVSALHHAQLGHLTRERLVLLLELLEDAGAGSVSAADEAEGDVAAVAAEGERNP